MDGAVSAQLGHPLDEGSGVSAIGPDPADPAEGLLQRAQDLPGPIPVLDRGWVNHAEEHESKRVHEYMPLPSLNLLSCIIAANSAVASSLDALRVDDRGRRGFFFPLRKRTYPRSWS